MRILMVSHAYPPTISGVTLVVQRIARAMVERGHQVTIICGTDCGEAYRVEDGGVRLIRVRGVANPWWKETIIPLIGRKELEEIVDEVRPDVLHAHEAGFLALQVLRLKDETRLPMVTTAYYVPRFVARYLTLNGEPHSLVESITWTYTTWIFNRFDHVVFATQAHRDAFLAQGLMAPASVISNGLDIARYCPTRSPEEDVEQRYELPPRPRVLFVSRLAKDKEIDVLIRAMRLVHLQTPAHLLLVGKGDDRQRLEQLVVELGVGQCVHFLGFLPEEDMPALYRACDLFAISSLYEVQSLPTLQATATGLPVVAADAMALPELVSDEVNGFLVPPDDHEAMAGAIVRILDHPDLAERMGRASLTIAQSHAEASTYDRYDALYRQMAGKSAAPEDQVLGGETPSRAFADSQTGYS